jgi:hypothetical protein
MNNYKISDLQCCANCMRWMFDDRCVSSTSPNKDIKTVPGESCDEWEWDEKKKEDRK